MRPVLVVLLGFATCKGGRNSEPPGPKVDVTVMPATYGDHAGASAELVEKCQFEKKLAEEVVEVTPGAKLATGSGKVLSMQVVTMRGVDPAWQGERSVIVHGELTDGGLTVGNFRIKRSALGGVFGGMSSVCRGLDDVAQQMADDILPWLRKPTEDAEL